MKGQARASRGIGPRAAVLAGDSSLPVAAGVVLLGGHMPKAA